jgi:hypothetical protein
MNQRIKELYDQASIRYSVYEILKPREERKSIPDIFAELIVRECAKKGFDVFDEEPDAPASDLQFYVRDGIKEHFGVE